MMEIRAARADDKEAVLAFCQQTFAWGDYIHYVYDQWLVDADGDMTVAVVDGVPVALARVRYLSPTEAWFEGLRVNPAYRRHGLATVVAEYNRERALTRGIKVGRAFISATNVASQTLSSRMGFAEVAQYRGWDLKLPLERAITPYLVKQATETDIQALLSFMHGYRHHLLSWHWHAQQVSEHALRRALADNSLWVAMLNEAVACVGTVTFWDDDKEMDVVGLFSEHVAPAEALVQHMVNEHLAGNIKELRLYQHQEQPPLDLARLGFEPNAAAQSGIWELMLT